MANGNSSLKEFRLIVFSDRESKRDSLPMKCRSAEKSLAIHSKEGKVCMSYIGKAPSLFDALQDAIAEAKGLDLNIVRIEFLDSGDSFE